MSHGKGSVIGQLAPVEYNRLTETVDHLISLPWRVVVLRHFEEEMRSTSKIHALLAIPYVKTGMQLRLAWCKTRLTMGEFDSEERKRSKEENVLLMTSLRDLMVCERAAVAWAKRRDALCFLRFMLEQMSVPALNNCAKMLREDSDLAKTMLLQLLLDIH